MLLPAVRIHRVRPPAILIGAALVGALLVFGAFQFGIWVFAAVIPTYYGARWFLGFMERRRTKVKIS